MKIEKIINLSFMFFIFIFIIVILATFLTTAVSVTPAVLTKIAGVVKNRIKRKIFEIKHKTSKTINKA